MEFPSEIKPALWGAAGGAILLAIVGFTWGGWMTTSAANKLADQRADVAVVAILTIPAERRRDRELGDSEKDLIELGAGQFRGEGRLGNPSGSQLPRLRSGAGMCGKAGPSQKRGPVIPVATLA